MVVAEQSAVDLQHFLEQRLGLGVLPWELRLDASSL